MSNTVLFSITLLYFCFLMQDIRRAGHSYSLSDHNAILATIIFSLDTPVNLPERKFAYQDDGGYCGPDLNGMDVHVSSLGHQL